MAKSLLLQILAVICISCSPGKAPTKVKVWLTTGDRKHLLERQQDLLPSMTASGNTTIEIDTTQVFQSMDGFGFALTGGSAWVIHQLPASKRDSLLKELFLPYPGLGISYLRVSIGASDLDNHVFSYDDLPKGQTDPDLAQFSLEPDQSHLIPILKEILAVNPHIKIMGSPWSAPVWMKTNRLPKSGSLKPEFYDTYARYLVKYVREMKAEGITIDGITIQNEPENPKNTPSMVMTAEEQRDFIAGYLGPQFSKADLQTKIIIFDHNCDHPEYPLTILASDAAKQYINGSAFHLYLGEINAMGKVHDAHPDKDVYFTEQWTSGKGNFSGDLLWHTKNLIIGATRNWSKIVLEWNLASDPEFKPHTNDGGCDLCMGALTIGDSISRNVSYYVIGHASAFVLPGSVRVGSTLSLEIPNVAFRTPSGQVVLIAMNEKTESQTFTISIGGEKFTTSIPAAAVTTFVF